MTGPVRLQPAEASSLPLLDSQLAELDDLSDSLCSHIGAAFGRVNPAQISSSISLGE